MNLKKGSYISSAERCWYANVQGLSAIHPYLQPTHYLRQLPNNSRNPEHAHSSSGHDLTARSSAMARVNAMVCAMLVDRVFASACDEIHKSHVVSFRWTALSTQDLVLHIPTPRRENRTTTFSRKSHPVATYRTPIRIHHLHTHLSVKPHVNPSCRVAAETSDPPLGEILVLAT